jgi:hypothetical protein
MASLGISTWSSPHDQEKKMMKMSNGSGVKLALLGLVIAGIGVAIGAGRQGASIADPTARVFVVPATQIISWNDTVARMDTTTGAIYIFKGSLRNESSIAQWEERVPGVRGETSGYLQMQRPLFDPDVTFLVDVVNGNTWILRRRSGDTATWEPANIVG